MNAAMWLLVTALLVNGLLVGASMGQSVWGLVAHIIDL